MPLVRLNFGKPARFGFGKPARVGFGKPARVSFGKRGRLAFGSRSLAALAVTAIGTQAFHPRILTALQRGETAAWLMALSAAALTALLIWPAAMVLRLLPGGTFAELARAAVGRWGAALAAIAWTASIIFGGGMILRQTSETAISAGFPHTPQTLVTTTLLLVAVYVGFGEGSSVVRFGTVVLPVLLIAILVVVFGTGGWGEFRYLLPLWGPGPLTLLLNAPLATALFIPGVVVLSSAARVDDRARLPFFGVAAILIGGLVIALVKVVLGMVFPYPIGLRIAYPLHAAARLVLGSRFFERLEGIWMFTWVVCTIVLLGAYLYSAALLFTRAFAIPRHTAAVPVLAALMLTVAFFPPDQATTMSWQEATAPVQFGVWLLLPLLLAGIAAIRLRARKP